MPAEDAEHAQLSHPSEPPRPSVQVQAVEGEQALKRFNRKVQQDGVLSEARRRAHYESPQARRKRKAAAQRRKQRRSRQPS